MENKINKIIEKLDELTKIWENKKQEAAAGQQVYDGAVQAALMIKSAILEIDNATETPKQEEV